MTAVWQTRLTGTLNRAGRGLTAAFGYFSQPVQLVLIQRSLLVLMALWIAASLWRGLWSFFPEAAPISSAGVINPVSSRSVDQATAQVDIDALVAAQLFGQPGSVVSAETLAAAGGRAPAMSESEAAVALAGIEDGAPETRLPLLLQGVVSASEAGLGQAIIEHRNIQDLYRVGDELPVSGEVSLAKVLPGRVVLDNGGRYELLRLFANDALSGQLEQLRNEPSPAPVQSVLTARAPERELTLDSDAAALAAEYRDQLYRDPESLTDIVRIGAVREGGVLQGYRVSPGPSADQFRALGFKAGDIVTGVNGMSLSDPANTVRLYQTMRSAAQASFELLREGQSVTLNVSIGAGGNTGNQ